jgi:hypothetical protein
LVGVTVTVLVAEASTQPPVPVTGIMVAVPAATPAIIPVEELTVAIPVALDDVVPICCRRKVVVNPTHTLDYQKYSAFGSAVITKFTAVL